MSIAVGFHFWSGDEQLFNYTDGDLSTHIYHTKKTSQGITYRNARSKWTELRGDVTWRKRVKYIIYCQLSYKCNLIIICG